MFVVIFRIFADINESHCLLKIFYRRVLMKVDVHCHFYPSEYVDTIRNFDSEKGSRITGIDFPLWISTEERIELMNKFGIDMEILSLSGPNVYFKDDGLSLELAQMTNEFVADLSQKYPDRFVGIASVPMLNINDAVAELHRAVEGLGLKGVVIGSHINGKRPDSPEFEPLFAEIERMEEPIFIHPMPPINVPESEEYKLSGLLYLPFETTISVTRMIFAGIFERHPKLSVILPHLGGTLPFLYTRIDLGFKTFKECREKASRLPSEYLKEFYYETAVAFGKPTLLCTSDLVGVEHIMFGTDYPFQRKLNLPISAIEALSIESEIKNKIFAGNAKSLFKLKA
jgi:aminocarboxymuconate-semialdehyde decarboxylase